jgi:hypothetical protein
MFVRKIDQNGFFLEDAFVDEVNAFTIETPCPSGFYHPKWDDSQWVEGLTAEEISALIGATPEPTTDEIVADLVTALAEKGILP